MQNYMLIPYFLRKVFNPEIFQGKYKTRNYFEGWYYKIIDSNLQNVLAVIPGISYDRIGSDRHAFIQVLDARSCMSVYLKFDVSLFKFNKDRLQIQIGGNYFTRDNIQLCISSKEITLSGKLTFKNRINLPKAFWRPGIMGPFTFIPFMECYHGIVSLNHDIYGSLELDGRELDFSNGYGYIEKDWGSSFPEAYLWLQSNHFGSDDVSVMFSYAKIPWLGRFFLGLISFIRIKDRTYIFATYTGAKIKKLKYENNLLLITLEDRKHRLEIEASHTNGGTLKAPKNGLMNREILESITATVRVSLSVINGGVIYEGKGTNTGLEIEDSIFKYFKTSNKISL